MANKHIKRCSTPVVVNTSKKNHNSNTRNLFNVINQCYPNTFNKIFNKIKKELVFFFNLLSLTCGRALHCFLSLRQILHFAKYKPLQEGIQTNVETLCRSESSRSQTLSTAH